MIIQQQQRQFIGRWTSIGLAVVLLGLAFLGPLATTSRAQSSTVSVEPLSDRRVAYDIDVELFAEDRRIEGRQVLKWTNPDEVAVSSLQFHLYLNAFKDTLSTFAQEGGLGHRGFSTTSEDPWGGIQVTRIVRSEGDTSPLVTGSGLLTDSLRFIQPDDGNENDRTVVELPLDRPVLPGETITLEMEFEADLPEVVARTGWLENRQGGTFFMVAQWFPKLGVYEVPGQGQVPADADKGAWYTHQFHANSEFYADFGVYEVAMTVPAEFVLGATGVLTGIVPASDSTRTHTYIAEDVHDFAWTTGDNLVEFEDTWQHVRLRFLSHPEHASQADRHFHAAKASLSRFSEWVGQYPYTTLTLVDGIGGSMGMEYPTLVTVGTFPGLPERMRMPEMITIHEFGHQYFYGLLASNEAEEAWLDEGINSYVEVRVVDKTYGPGGMLDLPWLDVSDQTLQRVSFLGSPEVRVNQTSWEYDDGFGVASYAKPAIALLSLEGYLGWETMQEILSTYYQEWRFKHPTTADFQAVAEKVVGRDLDWFFDQYIHGTVKVDYAVDDIKQDASGTHVVAVSRKAEGTFPQTLQVHFADGTSQDIKWDGLDRFREFRFDGEVIEARMDPYDKVPLDVARLNNVFSLNGPGNSFLVKAFTKATVFIQQIANLTRVIF